MSEDLVIIGARVRTQDARLPLASSVHVRDGVVVAVSAEPLRVRGARVIQAEGATVSPGFHDVHAHSVWFGLNQLELDVSVAASLTELYDLVAARSTALAADAWVIGTGFNPIALGERYPDRDALDTASGGRPVWLKHNSGHSAFLNGVALRRVADRSDLHAHIPGGLVVRDDAGNPTGVLEENALSLVQDIVLPYSTETLVRALDLATAIYVREGITSVTDAGIAGGWIGSSPREFLAYQDARDRGVLRTRMQPMIALDALSAVPGHADDPFALTSTGGIRTGLGDDWLQVGPAKIFSDGSLLGTTAALSEPYCAAHGEHSGYLQESPESLRERVLGACAAGWSVAMHAIGDRAVDHAISVLDEAHRRFGRRRIPNRIEHAGVVRDDQLPRLASLGAGVTPQPRFLWAFGDGMLARVGTQRGHELYRGRSFLEHGMALPGSSDRPVADGDPLRGIQSFIERSSASGTVIGPNERLTAEQALTAYTLGSARVTGTADRRGSIEPGKLADLVFLGDDPVTVETSRIGGIDVLATMVGGSFAHGAESFR